MAGGRLLVSGALLMAASMPRAEAATGSVQLTDQDLTKIGTGFGTIDCGYMIADDGNVYGNTGTPLEGWLVSGDVADFEVRAQVFAGTGLFGTFNTWLPCSANHAWSISATAGHTKNGIIQVSIRDVATSTVQATASITLTADNSGGGGGI